MRRSVLGAGVLLASLSALSLQFPTATAAGGGHQGRFNAEGNLLISDQYNNRAIELDPESRAIVWSFGSGNPSLCNPGPGAIIGPNDAERLGDGLTLLAGTGVPQGASPVDPNFSCADNRVIVVNQKGKIVWQYGRPGVTGSGPNQLNVPVFAIQLPSRNIMVVDQGNNRVIEIDRFTRSIVWSYGPTSGPGALNNPNSAELLRNGHVLIADENNNRVIEITRAGQIVWQYGSGSPSAGRPIQIAAFASRLPNGHTLITDSGHSRVIEVTEDKTIVWQYFTNRAPNSSTTPQPSNAVRLGNGDTSIADQFNHRVLIVNEDHQQVFQYGRTNMPGDAAGHLDGPYTSFVIGDYTGQTPPPDDF
ncbi:MAG: PQQ-binding-like beta-propeller repeat protein [Candidatus Dormibacteraeota bacterium]|nr:PQQ-binding-like beta-propeller repeat protein [Candidatus Dormibacteraeota bacterium]